MFRHWQDQVVIDTNIHHGDACIKGTRIPVSMIIGSLSDGLTTAEILDQYPQLKPADIQSALAYAAELMHNELVLPLSN